MCWTCVCCFPFYFWSGLKPWCRTHWCIPIITIQDDVHSICCIYQPLLSWFILSRNQPAPKKANTHPPYPPFSVRKPRRNGQKHGVSEFLHLSLAGCWGDAHKSVPTRGGPEALFSWSSQSDMVSRVYGSNVVGPGFCVYGLWPETPHEWIIQSTICIN